MPSPVAPVAETADPLLAARDHISQFAHNTLDWNLCHDLQWPAAMPAPRVEVEFAGFDSLRLVTTIGYGPGPGDIIVAEQVAPHAEPQLWWGYADEDNNGQPRPAHLPTRDAELIEQYARAVHRNAERIAIEAIQSLVRRLDLSASIAARATTPLSRATELEVQARRCVCSWRVAPDSACLGCGLSREESEALLAGHFVAVYVVDSTRGGGREESRFFTTDVAARRYAAILTADRNRGDVRHGYVPVPAWVEASDRTDWCRAHPSVRSWLLTIVPL